MEVEQRKEDVRQGRIKPERLVDLLAQLAGELQRAKERIGELEKKLGGSATATVKLELAGL